MTASKTRAVPNLYADNPHAFGRRPIARWSIPPLGNESDLRLAKAQHAVLLELHENHDPGRARRLAGLFGFSTQRWSEYSLGKAWFTTAAWAAAVTEIIQGNCQGEP